MVAYEHADMVPARSARFFVLACLLALACGQTLAPQKGKVYKCTWSDADKNCGVNTYYFLSTETPTPINPYTKRILGIVAKDFKCAAYANAKKCNAAYKDTCIWDPDVGCSYAITNEWACPGSRAANFLRCDYFNLVKAPPSACRATTGCIWTKGRGCFGTSFTSWGPKQLLGFRGNLTAETVPLPYYGCCSSFLSRRDLYPDTCYDLNTKADCVKAAKAAKCAWTPGTGCDLSNDGIYTAELDGLKTADPPFGVAYAKADDACYALTTKAQCQVTTATLDAKKVARFQQPHREAALDYKSYCGTTILGP